jgi:RNA polymerase sigma factor (sigma-70 family)
MNEHIDSQTLYAACQQDESPAQVEAFKILWAHLYRIAWRMLGDRADQNAIAADCAQNALIKIHRNLAQCHNPAAFREWAAQIVRRSVIDELRRPEHTRQTPLPDDDDHLPWLATPQLPSEAADLRTLLIAAIEHGPMSERSKRIVVGRYFEEQPDEVLARAESQLAGKQVLPSHIQVTRAKNLATLRRDTALLARLRELIEDS